MKSIGRSSGSRYRMPTLGERINIILTPAQITLGIRYYLKPSIIQPCASVDSSVGVQLVQQLTAIVVYDS